MKHSPRDQHTGVQQKIFLVKQCKPIPPEGADADPCLGEHVTQGRALREGERFEDLEIQAAERQPLNLASGVFPPRKSRFVH